MEKKAVATIKRNAVHKVDQLADEVWEMSLELHSNPELGFEEHIAAEILTSMLRKHGFKIVRPVAGLDTAFSAVFNEGAPGPKVTFIAEYDALPGIGHGCGHNIIAGAAVSAALALRYADGFTGQVTLMGTPAEEGGGGKVKMLKAGSFDGLDIGLMIHPYNRTRIGDRCLAIDELKVTFIGKAAHASAEPEKGINALDAVIAVFNGISQLRQHVTPDVRMHGIITEGGLKPNIVPDRASAHFYLRAADERTLASVVKRVRAIIDGAEKATGAKAKVDQIKGFKSRKMAWTAIDTFANNLESLGVRTERAAENTFTGSSDIGDLSHVLPVVHEYIAICDPDEAAIHSKAFTIAARTKRARKAMLSGAKALALTAIDLFMDEDLFSKVKTEFRAGINRTIRT